MLFFKKKPQKIGLALGGGAVRGIAHLGVLKVLQKHHIHIDYIAGTSVGSIFGGCYAINQDIDKLISLVQSIAWKDLATFSFSPKALTSNHALAQFIEQQFGHVCFKQLALPFAAVATNLLTGQEEVLNSPDFSLSKAIQASCAFPGFYLPVKLNNQHYIDGGCTNNVPVSVVRKMGADFIIAVDVIPQVTLKELPNNFLFVIDRAIDILHNAKTDYQSANIVLRPITENINSFDLKFTEKLIQLGEAAMEAQLYKIPA